MSDEYITKNIDQKYSYNADEVEIKAVKFGTCSIEESAHDNKIANELDDFISDPKQDHLSWKGRQDALESIISGVKDQIKIRENLLGKLYPFAFDEKLGGLTYKNEECRIYEFCLAVSVSNDKTTGENTKIPQIFERVINTSSKAIFGVRGKGIHVGYPRDSGTKIKEVFENLRKQACKDEWIWNPESNMPNNPNTTFVKDLNIDFIIWNGLDRRVGNLYILGQCASGNNWETKVKDISISRLSRWFSRMAYMKILKIFAVPFCIVAEKQKDLSMSSGLLLDRTRITKLFVEAVDNTGDEFYIQYLNKEMENVIEMILKQS